MRNFKKLLLCGCCCANFYAFADVDVYNDSDLSASSETEITSEGSSLEIEDTNSSSIEWLTEYPTYIELNAGLGLGSKFTYTENPDIKGDVRQRVLMGPMGLEVGKIIDAWRFGPEIIFLFGKAKQLEITDEKDNTRHVIKASVIGGSLMGNVYYDIPLTGAETTYQVSWAIGAGLGLDYLKIKMKYSGPEEDMHPRGKSFLRPACQLRTGLALDFDNFRIYVGYRLHQVLGNLGWTSIPNDKDEDSIKSKWGHPTVHIVESSFTWRFE